MKTIINDEKTTMEYIKKVLTEWTAFCEGHPMLAQALEILLKRVEENGI